MLSFCKPESWTGKNKTEILSGFVAAAATSRSDGKLTSGTETMNKMVDLLNDPSTPSVIKKDFIDLLKVDIKQKKGQSKAESVVTYKFKTSDFDGLLNKIQADKPQSKTKPQPRKKKILISIALKKERMLLAIY